jgi:hypothetical protein
MNLLGRLLMPVLKRFGVKIPPGAAATPVGDDEIRAAFVGKAACPPKPWPVGFGPYEFHADGEFVRAQDLASLYGRYTISGGRICVTSAGNSPPDLCLAVLKEGDQYFFRDDTPPVPAPPRLAFSVTLCPLQQ